MSERLIRLLRARAAPACGVADAELLRRWADGRDEAAFELLLRRHAEPVWRCCRAVAGEGAEDAFQATFLALSRRAGAVRGSLPGWLHRVARHAAFKARRGVGRAESAKPDSGAVSGVGLRELSPTYAADELATLHEELARLPDRYRLPVVLCHLHGRTQAEAAKELGLPLGTVATRVRRGCDRLKVALTRRGFAPGIDFGPPLLLPAGALTAALGVGLGAAAPPAVHLLATGALFAMSRTKLKLLAAVALVGTAVGGGTLVARHTAPADPQPPPAATPASKWEPRPADYFDRKDGFERLKQLLLAVHNFHDANGEKLPADIVGKDGKPLLSWRVAVLAYIDQELLSGMFNRNEPWDSPTNKALLKHMPKAYRSPGAGVGLTRVKMFRGPDATLDPAGGRTFTDFTDGMSNTLGVVDAGAAVEWTKPGDLDYLKGKPLPDLSGPFTDGFAGAFLDGSVRWVDRRSDETFLRRVIERNDGMVVVEPELPDRPKRPLSEREKRQAAEWLRLLTVARSRAGLAAAQRAAVTAALAKFETVGLPAPPPADDLFAIEQQLNDLNQLDATDSAVAARLLDRLKQKDPAAAEAIRQEYGKKFLAAYDEWMRQQPKK